MLRYALHLTRGDHDLAEEIVQEAAVRMCIKFNRLKEEEAFTAWGMLIVRRVLIDKIRAQKVHKNVPMDDALLFVDAASDVHSLTDKQLANDELNKAISILSIKQQEVLALWASGMTEAEYAAVLGLRIAQAKGRLNNARQRLRAYFRRPPTNMSIAKTKSNVQSRQPPDP